MKKRFSLFASLSLVVVTLLSLVATQAASNSVAQSTAAATMAALGPTPTALPLSGDPILIGVALAQTGSSSLLGQDQVVGAKIAEAYFNQRGGVNGRPIKLVYQDAGSTPDTATQAFNTLINGNVVAIVGPTLSTQAFAADPVASKAGVPVLAPSNTAGGIPQLGAYVTRISAGVASYAVNAITLALKQNPGIKNVAVEYAQDDIFSTSETKVFQAGVKADNLNLTTVQTHSTKDTDFTNQTSAILATNPDLIIISGLAVDGANLVKQLRDLGYKGVMIGGNGLNTANIYPVCQASCDGLLIAQAYYPLLVSPINGSFTQAYQLAQNKPHSPQLTAQTFTAIQVVVQALSALDKASALTGLDLPTLRTKLNDQIQSGSFDTPLGKISFTKTKDKDGNVAGAELNQTEFGVAQIKMNADGQTGTFQINEVAAGS